MMKRAVVTGGAGRIGTRVANKLAQAGYDVVRVDKAPTNTDNTDQKHLGEYVHCDLARAIVNDSKDALALDSACRAADVVVHCAAWPGPAATPPPAVVASGAAVTPRIGLEPASPAEVLADNVGSTSAVCDAAVRAGASRVVLSSSAFAIGYSHAAAGPQAYAPRRLPVRECDAGLPARVVRPLQALQRGGALGRLRARRAPRRSSRCASPTLSRPSCGTRSRGRPPRTTSR
jgi:nucleoside-diphosphate-sugar epimerase